MNRKEELSNYLNLLLHLESTGIICKVKIKQVLSELHKEMGFEDKPEFEMSVFINKSREVADEIIKGVSLNLESGYRDSPFDVFG